jgi:hypothetical protein
MPLAYLVPLLAMLASCFALFTLIKYIYCPCFDHISPACLVLVILYCTFRTVDAVKESDPVPPPPPVIIAQLSGSERAKWGGAVIS